MVIEPSKDSKCSLYSYSDCLVCPKDYHYILEKSDSGKNVRLCQHNSFRCEEYNDNRCHRCKEGYGLVIYQLGGRYCKKWAKFKNYSFYFSEGLVLLMNIVLAGYIMKGCLLARKKDHTADVVQRRQSITPDFPQLRAKLSSVSPEPKIQQTKVKKLKFENARQKKPLNSNFNDGNVQYNILNTVESQPEGKRVPTSSNLETKNY